MEDWNTCNMDREKVHRLSDIQFSAKWYQLDA